MEEGKLTIASFSQVVVGMLPMENDWQTRIDLLWKAGFREGHNQVLALK